MAACYRCSPAAPLQVSWLGYPASTGVSAIDARLTDALADPEGEADALASEALIRLPAGFLCYAPLDDVPLARSGAEASGVVTFGCFNNLNKITPQVLALWVKIVVAVPGARLYLKSQQLAVASVRDRVAAFAAAQGLSPERLRLAGWKAAEQHLASYREIDIALDPFPYNGTTTTCEALLMGVPVISLRGDNHAGRVGASLLTRVGCPELVAADVEDYARLAIQLAGDEKTRLQYHHELSSRFRSSALMDNIGFARQFESAIRTLLASRVSI